MADNQHELNGICPLDEKLLEEVVGGTALPASFDRYVNAKGGIVIYDQRPGSFGQMALRADVQKVSAYLDRLESKGCTTVALVVAESGLKETFTIDQVREMLSA